MINIPKQILYWQTGAEDELLNARIMIENKRILAGLFFCHLCIEKVLKAIIVSVTKDHPPKTHNLMRLAEIAKISFDEQQIRVISILQVYQLEGRYPETYPTPPGMTITNEYYNATKNLHLWLSQKL